MSALGVIETSAPFALIWAAEPAWISSAVAIVCDSPITFHVYGDAMGVPSTMIPRLAR